MKSPGRPTTQKPESPSSQRPPIGTLANASSLLLLFIGSNKTPAIIRVSFFEIQPRVIGRAAVESEVETVRSQCNLAGHGFAVGAFEHKVCPIDGVLS